MKMSAVLTVGSIIIIVILAFSSALSLDMPFVIALIISVFSAGAAALSALFAWRSIGFARRQNTIAAQTALLESLLHRRAKLEGIRIKIIKENTNIKVKLDSGINELREIINDTETEKSVSFLIFLEQQTADLIFCLGHYFNDNTQKQLSEWLKYIGRCRTLEDFQEELKKQDMLSKFTQEIIPEKLAEIEKEIRDLETKLREVFK